MDSVCVCVCMYVCVLDKVWLVKLYICMYHLFIGYVCKEMRGQVSRGVDRCFGHEEV